MSESLGYSDEEIRDAREDKTRVAEEAEALRADFAAAFDSPAGQRVFEYLYIECRQNRSTYSLGQDVTHTAFLEGRRSVVLDIMRMLDWDDTEIITRARERAQENPHA